MQRASQATRKARRVVLLPVGLTVGWWVLLGGTGLARGQEALLPGAQGGAPGVQRGVAGASPVAQTPPSSQPRPTVSEIAERVERARAGDETLQGEFAQKKRLSLFKEDVRSSGKFAFKRPAKLRWEYGPPDESLVIIDGTRLTTKMPGAKPETHDLARHPTLKTFLGPLFAALGSVPLREAAKDFEMTVVGPQALRLVPKGEAAQHLRFFELRFDAEWRALGIRILEKNGDETEITFRRVRRNVRLDESLFRP